MTDAHTPIQRTVATDAKGNVYMLTPLSVLILKHLDEWNGKANYSHICAHVAIAKSTLFVYAQRLEECGLVTRVADKVTGTTLVRKVKLKYATSVLKV